MICNMWMTSGSGYAKLERVRCKYSRKSKKALWAIAQAKSPPMYEDDAYEYVTRADIRDELIFQELNPH